MDLASTIAAAGGSVALLTAMVIGVVEFIKRLFDRDFRAATIIGASAVVGGLGGWLLFHDIGFALGVVTGFAASGLVTGLSKIGNGSTSAPTTLSGNSVR